MTDYLIRWIDVGPSLQSGEQPAFLFERALPRDGRPSPSHFTSGTETARQGEYLTANSPLFSEEVTWAITRNGQYVRIPIFAYKTQQRAVSTLFGLGIQIGMQAIISAAPHFTGVPLEVVLILGHECHDLTPEEAALRGYVGVALRIK